MGFVHLNVRSEYSLLDGMIRIGELAPYVKELGMEAVALTDNANLFGAVDFYKSCKQEGVKPIIGAHIYVFTELTMKEVVPTTLIMLCKNQEGYKNLIKLVSEARLSHLDEPRIPIDLLEKHKDGLICIISSSESDAARAILNGKDPLKYVETYHSIFGDDLYLEITALGSKEQEKIANEFCTIAQQLGVRVVATNPAYYLKKGDGDVYDIFSAIDAEHALLHGHEKLTSKSDLCYVRNADEIQKAFTSMTAPNDPVAETMKIAAQCTVEFDLETKHLPKFTCPKNKTPESFLQELCDAGLKKYTGNKDKAKQQLTHELEIIQKTGFDSYFLIVWDFIEWAKQNGVIVGPGRGSAPGSIVAYFLGITDIDPLDNGLLFERFLNPERLSMPDIDTDFDDRNRPKMFEYMRERYGNNCVAHIATFDRMMAKAAIKDVARVLGIPFAEANEITKHVSSRSGLADSIEQSEVLQEYKEQYPELFEAALKLEGIARNIGVHAAGIVVSDVPLTEHVALQEIGGEVLTQLEMNAVESIGLLKFDFLGLRFLTIINDTLELIKAETRKEIVIDYTDAKTYQMLSDGKSLGLFQLESDGMRDLLKNFKPTELDDITLIISLFRPGSSEFIPTYLARRHGSEKVSYIHPLLEKIVKNTLGIIVYQEQVMLIARDMAGYTLGQADILRRAMGKKSKKLMASQEKAFLDGCTAKGIEPKIAEEVWLQIVKFAGYGFNKAHAAAYAVVSYKSAFLKANYPLEYLCALLTSVIGSEGYTQKYVSEAHALGLAFDLPDINLSPANYAIHEGKLLFGLGCVKNVGYSLIEEILARRPYTSFVHFCEKIGDSRINKRAVESLIKAGCFDSLGEDRDALLDNYEALMKRAKKGAGQKTLAEMFGNVDDTVTTGDADAANSDETGTNAEIDEKKMHHLTYEKEVLSVFVSGHPLDKYSDIYEDKRITASTGLQDLEDEASVTIAGMIARVHEKHDKNGNLMAFLTIMDIEGSTEVIVFSSIYGKKREELKEGMFLIIGGKLSRGRVIGFDFLKDKKAFDEKQAEWERKKAEERKKKLEELNDPDAI